MQHRVVDLMKLLPASNLESACFSGFAEGANVIFVSTNDGCVFSNDLNSKVVRKVCEMSYGSRIFPYVCFYTPAGIASLTSVIMFVRLVIGYDCLVRCLVIYFVRS